MSSRFFGAATIAAAFCATAAFAQEQADQEPVFLNSIAPNEVSDFGALRNSYASTDHAFLVWQAARTALETAEAGYDGRDSAEIVAELAALQAGSAAEGQLSAELAAARVFEARITALGAAADTAAQRYEAALVAENTLLLSDIQTGPSGVVVGAVD